MPRTDGQDHALLEQDDTASRQVSPERAGRGSTPRFAATPSGVMQALRASRRESGDRELLAVVAASGVQFLEHPELPRALAMLQPCSKCAQNMNGVARVFARLAYLVGGSAPAALWAWAAWKNVSGCDSDSQFEYLTHLHEYDPTKPVGYELPWWRNSTGFDWQCQMREGTTHKVCGKVPLVDFGDSLADLGVAGISLATWWAFVGLIEALKPGGTLDKLIEPTKLGPLKISHDERRSLKRWNTYLTASGSIAVAIEIALFWDEAFNFFDPGFDSVQTWRIAIALLCLQTTVVVLWCLAMRFAVTLASAVIIGIRVEIAMSHGDDFTMEAWQLRVHVRD